MVWDNANAPSGLCWAAGECRGLQRVAVGGGGAHGCTTVFGGLHSTWARVRRDAGLHRHPLEGARPVRRSDGAHKQTR